MSWVDGYKNKGKIVGFEKDGAFITTYFTDGMKNIQPVFDTHVFVYELGKGGVEIEDNALNCFNISDPK